MSRLEEGTGTAFYRRLLVKAHNFLNIEVGGKNEYEEIT